MQNLLSATNFGYPNYKSTSIIINNTLFSWILNPSRDQLIASLTADTTVVTADSITVTADAF